MLLLELSYDSGKAFLFRSDCYSVVVVIAFVIIMIIIVIVRRRGLVPG
jgi:hypothetical protein